MILTVHNLAKEYAVLPSEALSRSNTFDLFVLDVATRWQIHQHKEFEAQKGNSLAPRPPKLTQAEMLDMIARARGEKK